MGVAATSKQFMRGGINEKANVCNSVQIGGMYYLCASTKFPLPTQRETLISEAWFT